MKLMYESLIIRTFNSELQPGALNGIAYQNCKNVIMSNSRYDAHMRPLFKQLHLLKVKEKFEIQCPQLWYKYVNNKVSTYFGNMFTYKHELH